MGERRQSTLWVPTFNRSVRVQAAQADLSSDGGALVVREAAHRTGLWKSLEDGLVDPRDPARITHTLVAMVMTRVALLAQGWRDLDDADTLRHDEALRVAVGRPGGRVLDDDAPNLASQPTLSRMMASLADPRNAHALHATLGEQAERCVRGRFGVRDEVTIDMDSFPIAAHGHPEGATYNPHYGEVCYHPIVAYLDGAVLGVRLRPGDVHTADDAQAFLEPLVVRARRCGRKVWTRIDAGYASGAMFDWMDAHRVRFITRLTRNPALSKLSSSWVEQVRAEWATSRDPSERRVATREFTHGAGRWSRKRRVIAVMVEHADGDGELFDNVFYLCTNASMSEGGSLAILDRYRKRGRAENHIGELVNVIGTRLPHASLAQNDAALVLGCLAYNTVHVVRTGLAAATSEGWSLQSVRERVLKVAVQVTRHARRLVFHVALSAKPLWTALEAIFATLDAATTCEVAG